MAICRELVMSGGEKWRMRGDHRVNYGSYLHSTYGGDWRPRRPGRRPAQLAGQFAVTNITMRPSYRTIAHHILCRTIAYAAFRRYSDVTAYHSRRRGDHRPSDHDSMSSMTIRTHGQCTVNRSKVTDSLLGTPK